MSHIENEVDYVPDSEKEPEPDPKEPFNSCKNCFHKDVCYWYTQLNTMNEGFKAGKVTQLPFDPAIIGTKCSAFITKGGVKNTSQEEVTHDPAQDE